MIAVGRLSKNKGDGVSGSIADADVDVDEDAADECDVDVDVDDVDDVCCIDMADACTWLDESTCFIMMIICMMLGD